MGLALSNDGKPVPSKADNGCCLIPKGAKNVEVAKDFLKYFIQPQGQQRVSEDGAGPEHSGDAVGRQKRPVVARPQDPHGVAYVRQAVLGPTVPNFWVFNPAYAQVQNEHVWSIGLDRHHAGWHDAAGGGGKGVQEGRGDLREIPDC